MTQESNMENRELERRPHDLNSEYANNTLFEASVWDLKVIFGELFRTRDGKASDVDWHTAITMPWPQVKLFSYYLQVNLMMHESETGKIQIPERLHPDSIAPTESEKDDPEAMARIKALQELRAKFVESMK